VRECRIVAGKKVIKRIRRVENQLRILNVCNKGWAVYGTDAAERVGGGRWSGKRFDFKVSYDEAVIRDVEGGA
jgi:hypothetical protein